MMKVYHVWLFPFQKGVKKSKTQEMVLEYLNLLHHERNSERAGEFHEKLKSIDLKNTDEDRIFRETFRDEDKSIRDWDTDELLDSIERFLDEYIEESAEYQTTLAGSSSVQAELMCWGVIKG